jgi:sporulation and spore germination protein/immunoglobulin-like protein involved in spore germination
MSSEKGVIDSSSVSSNTAATPARSEPKGSTALEIYIDSVVPANPLVVFGRGRTFENTVQVRARDADGNIVATEHVTSVGEMGHHNPYTAQLWIARDPGPRLTVEAFEYSAADGTVRSLTTKVVPYDGGRTRVTLDFPVGKDCIETRAFTRLVPKSVGIARLLVEALIAGPDAAAKAAGAVSPFPQGSDLNSVVLRDGVLTVDFNERLRNVGGSCAATAIRESVTRTLARLPTVTRVVISAAGSEKLALQP